MKSSEFKRSQRIIHAINHAHFQLSKAYPAGVIWKYRQLATITSIHRSSRLKVFCKKGVLKNFVKFTWKHLARGSFLGLRPAIWFKKRLWHRCFYANFAKFLRTSFSQNTSGWLLLNTSSDVCLKDNVSGEKNISCLMCD